MFEAEFVVDLGDVLLVALLGLPELILQALDLLVSLLGLIPQTLFQVLLDRGHSLSHAFPFLEHPRLHACLLPLIHALQLHESLLAPGLCLPHFLHRPRHLLLHVLLVLHLHRRQSGLVVLLRGLELKLQGPHAVQKLVLQALQVK